MASTSFDSGWQWPDNLPGRFHHDEEETKPRQRSDRPHNHASSSAQQGQGQQQNAPPRERFWPPRTCRICLETVLPTFHSPPDGIMAGVFQAPPAVTYESPDLGRLLRPCLCKGSQKFVHEGCLTAWRMADPLRKRNYWQCPTCKYNYRLERMTWGKWISSGASQVALTVMIFLVAIFLLGYVADPIINFYLDPYGTITSLPIPSHAAQSMIWEDEPVTWAEHIAKGFASLGLLGFAKFLLTLSPWQWWNMRGSGLGSGHHAGSTGRDRLSQISWIAVLVGVTTVTWAVWKGVRAWCRRTLEKASEHVMDVPQADDADDD